MTLTSEAGVGVRASDGKLMWRYPAAVQRHGEHRHAGVPDNKVFYTSNYGTGGALLSLRADGGEVRMQELYFTRDMQNHHGGVVLVNGYPVRVQQFDPDVPGVCHRQGVVATPERRQGVARLRGRSFVSVQREQRRRSRRGQSVCVSRERTFYDCRSRLAVVGSSGRQRRSAIPAESGYSYRVRHPGELAGSG